MKRFLLSAFLILLTIVLFTPVKAQSQNPSDLGAWGEVVDENGNIRYGNLIDLGVHTDNPSWMHFDLPLGLNIPLEANYHTYQTSSGNIVVLPSATTLLFMAFNPDESGLNRASSSLGTAAGVLEMLAGPYLNLEDILAAGYDSREDFFYDVSHGNPSALWSAMPNGMLSFLSGLLNASLNDQQLYLMMLLYTPDMCNQVPGGCPPEAQLPAPPPTNDHDCGTPSTSAGQITVTAHKIAPNNALVVGQDPNRVGADLVWTVRIEPTTYTWWEKKPTHAWICHAWQSGDGTANCRTSPMYWYDNGILQQDLVGYTCEQHTQIYPEALRWVNTIASLSQSSREWILNGDLQIRYPGAYLHHPEFTFAGSTASGSFQGDTFVWTMSQSHVQVADPGWFSLDAAGATTGTDISDPRPFRRNGGTFPVYLEETTIIQ
jgi:hypothetical protein